MVSMKLLEFVKKDDGVTETFTLNQQGRFIPVKLVGHNSGNLEPYPLSNYWTRFLDFDSYANLSVLKMYYLEHLFDVSGVSHFPISQIFFENKLELKSAVGNFPLEKMFCLVILLD